MNKIQELQQRVLQEFPGVKIQLEKAGSGDPCPYWLYINLSGRNVVAQWVPWHPNNLGLSWKDLGGFSNSSEEVYPSVDEAVLRIKEILTH